MFGFAKDRSLELLAKTQEQQAQMLALVSKSVDAVSQRIEDAEKRREEESRRFVSVDWKGYGDAHREALVSVEDYKAEQVRKQEKEAEAALVEKQKRVAYALNLCMVSLSQIVDYQDVNVLQQEYDAVLNNLNMEKVEKDEALLDALKKILDTCHFYLLHAKDKEILKKKQAARLKGALGKALGGGNVMAIFGTPNPWAIGAAVLAMAGTAAVRYKSERDKAKLDNEVEEWELEKSALEQLHNLRRTLFETAWRLADKYAFSDRYRLTERQIKVYDDILSEADPMNRYERLELIKDSFDAYPLYWYYLGRAALETANLYKPVDDETRKITPGIERIGGGNAEVYRIYMERARGAFDGFRKSHEGNEVLREDLLSASAYLDYACFFDDPVTILTYVDKAHDLAGMDYEINQMCAFRYLQCHELFYKNGDKSNSAISFSRATHCLRFLLNEGFNPELNGRALSQLYIMHRDEESCQAAYNLLKVCIARKNPYVYGWMLPWDDVSLRRDVDAYLKGDGVRRTIFNYQYGRLRLIYGDLFSAINRSCRENDLQPIRDLKENYQVDGNKLAWDENYDMGFEKFLKWDDDGDPICAFQRQFWLHEQDVTPPKGLDVSAKASGLISEARKLCREKEYSFVVALKTFIHGTSERKWYTLGCYRHDSDFCASVVDADVRGIETAMADLAKAVAEIEAEKLLMDYQDSIKHDLEFPDDAAYEKPVGIQIIEYMESEAERMRKQIATATGGRRFIYPQVEFRDGSRESLELLAKTMYDNVVSFAHGVGSVLTRVIGAS